MGAFTEEEGLLSSGLNCRRLFPENGKRYSPRIMCLQYHGGAQYRGREWGNLEYRGRISR